MRGADEMDCSRCGTPAIPGDRVCGVCGAPLALAADEPPRTAPQDEPPAAQPAIDPAAPGESTVPTIMPPPIAASPVAALPVATSPAPVPTTPPAATNS